MDHYDRSGEHPLIKRYNELLNQLKRLSIEISEAERSCPKPIAKYGDPIATEYGNGIIFTRRLLNREERDEYMKMWGHVDGFWDETRASVCYTRTSEGILTSLGGGWVFLKGLPTIVSDEEWEAMKSGNIPSRLLKD